MIDPTVVIAIVTVIGSIFAGWFAYRKEEKTAKITARSDTNRTSVEFGVKREELLSAGIEAHFNRLEHQLVEATKRIDTLTDRVDQLEAERQRMLWWMAFNKLTWPPPEDAPF